MFIMAQSAWPLGGVYVVGARLKIWVAQASGLCGSEHRPEACATRTTTPTAGRTRVIRSAAAPRMNAAVDIASASAAVGAVAAAAAVPSVGHPVRGSIT